MAHWALLCLTVSWTFEVPQHTKLQTVSSTLDLALPRESHSLPKPHNVLSCVSDWPDRSTFGTLDRLNERSSTFLYKLLNKTNIVPTEYKSLL
jgi:hypothetical protein